MGKKIGDSGPAPKKKRGKTAENTSPAAVIQEKRPSPVAKKRDGTILSIGDEVETDIYEKCRGHVFIICEITPYANCESGTIVLTHLKGSPERKLTGIQKEGYLDNHPPGLDANWFKKRNP